MLDRIANREDLDLDLHCLLGLLTGSFKKIYNNCLFVLLLYVPNQQLWSWREGQFI